MMTVTFMFMQSTGKRDRREAEKELHRIMEPFVAGDEVALSTRTALSCGHSSAS